MHFTHICLIDAKKYTLKKKKLYLEHKNKYKKMNVKSICERIKTYYKSIIFFEVIYFNWERKNKLTFFVQNSWTLKLAVLKNKLG